MMDDVGLNEKQKEIIDWVRSPSTPWDVTNDDVAEHFGLSKKAADNLISSMFYALQREMFNLAIIGWRVKHPPKTEDFLK